MSEKAEKFIEIMGRHWEEEGAPRIAGRLLGALLLNAKPCSLDDLTAQLNVSKGSVSSNARLLETWGVAEKVTVPGDRRDFYQVSKDFDVRVLRQQAERSRLLLQRLTLGEEAVGSSNEEVRRRFDSVTRHVQETLRLLEAKLENLERANR